MRSRSQTNVVYDPHTVVINGRAHWFANLAFAAQERRFELDRQIRHLTAERARVANELLQLRGAREYASITANNAQVDGEGGE